MCWMLPCVLSWDLSKAVPCYSAMKKTSPVYKLGGCLIPKGFLGDVSDICIRALCKRVVWRDMPESSVKNASPLPD